MSLALAGLILAAFVSLHDIRALRKHYKKPANLDSWVSRDLAGLALKSRLDFSLQSMNQNYKLLQAKKWPKAGSIMARCARDIASVLC